MVKTRQQTGGLDPVQRRNPSERIPKTLRPAVEGTDLTPRRISLGSKPWVCSITDLELGEKSNPSSFPPKTKLTVEHQGDPQERSLASVDVGGEVAQEKCIPIPQCAETRLVAVGTQGHALGIQVMTWILGLYIPLNGNRKRGNRRGSDRWLQVLSM